MNMPVYQGPRTWCLFCELLGSSILRLMGSANVRMALRPDEKDPRPTSQYCNAQQSHLFAWGVASNRRW